MSSLALSQFRIFAFAPRYVFNCTESRFPQTSVQLLEIIQPWQAIESVLVQKVNFDYEIVIGEDCSHRRHAGGDFGFPAALPRPHSRTIQ